MKTNPVSGADKENVEVELGDLDNIVKLEPLLDQEPMPVCQN